MKSTAYRLPIIFYIFSALGNASVHSEPAIVSTNSNLAGLKIAVGQPAKTVQPSMPAAPSSMPFARVSAPASSSNNGPSIDSAPADLGSAKPTNSDIPANPAGKPDTANAPNAVSVEFDEGLAPKSTLPGLSVAQALNYALVNGPRAAAVRAQFAISRAQYASATQATNPGIFMDRGLVAEQVMRLGPVMTLDPPWRLFFRLQQAKRMVAQSKIDLLTTVWSLRNDVRNAYVEVVVAQETQKTLIQLYEIANRLAEVSEKRFHAGDVPELDLLKANLARDQAQIDVGVGSKRVIRSKQLLNILMGKDADAPLSVPELPSYTSNEPRIKLRAEKSDILPDFNHDVSPLQAFINRGVASRLELKSLTAQVAVNNVSAKSNYAAIIPNTSFATGKDESGNPPGGPKLTAVSMTLNQELPFTNIQQGGIYQYRAIAKQLRFQIDAQQNQVNQDVSGAYNNLLAARDKIRVYQDRLLTDSNEVARLARRSYESGQSDITSTIQAQQLNVQTRIAYLDAVSSYATAFTALEFAVGRPLQ